MAITSPPFAWPDGALDQRRVIQCALSRVCGGCGRPLGRPIAFVGTADEVGRNEFHAPPLHQGCAASLVQLGVAGTSLIATAGFEFVRATSEDADRRPRFVPNSIL